MTKRKFQVEISGRGKSGWCYSCRTIKAKNESDAGNKGLKIAGLADSRIVKVLEISKNYNNTFPF